MYKILKELCNNNPLEMIKFIIEAIIAAIFGAAWFYIMALCIILIGG